MTNQPDNIRELVQNLASQVQGENTELVEVSSEQGLVINTDQNDRLISAAEQLQEASDLIMSVLRELEADGDTDNAVIVAKLGVVLSLTGLQLSELGDSATITDEVKQPDIAVHLPST